MKKLASALLVPMLVVSLNACGGDSDASDGSAEPSGPAAVVDVTGMAYTPAEVTIEVGETVEWHFDDGGIPHDVAGDGALAGQLQSDLLTEGTYSYTFKEAGTFTYHCTPHPQMVGTVVVEG
ncbi:cupredoxin domain-containing protein [Nocardioides houyundeii]|uniref:cupredoxin domain-containing protein n=1 Tax=Nocardioides houyundeii TaxID=2045452 RepID=UPI000DF201A4|nr:plastocyanin/azurin family copper-binding protein [Nocardioides houyundeii]